MRFKYQDRASILGLQQMASAVISVNKVSGDCKAGGKQF